MRLKKIGRHDSGGLNFLVHKELLNRMEFFLYKLHLDFWEHACALLVYASESYELYQTGEFPMDCPLQDSVLRIHYKGFLPDKGGQLFYDSRKEPGGEPVTFGSDEGLVRYS
jgi:hypothetical protein